MPCRAPALVKDVPPGGVALSFGGEAVGELLAVVGQDFLESERPCGGQTVQELLGNLAGHYFEVDPAAGPRSMATHR
jgi:hypothetical protein